MTIIEPEITSPRPLHWVVFCAAIDNFGDIGVCWRLARQLSTETEAHVELWVDDWVSLQWFLRPMAFTGVDGAQCAGVRLRHWQITPTFAGDAERIAQADIVIESFACELPSPLVRAMKRSERPPLWLNLEYLSAEPWVSDCHQLPSLQGGGQSLNKYFFFPGFVDGTGGLLREHDLVQRHDQWQQSIARHRTELVQDYALPQSILANPDLLFVSVFTYEGKPLRSLIKALIESDAPTLCFAPLGRSVQDIAHCFDLSALPVAGSVLNQGNLWVLVLPFMSQQEYDYLLSLCDFNFVRGEDSFVRAQFAGHPLLWHLYPQPDDAHLVKLEAFLTLYSGNSPFDEALKAFWRRWNQGEDCYDLWHYLRPQLPSLQLQARRWQQQLAEKPDLVANLLAFHRAQRASVHTESDCG